MLFAEEATSLTEGLDALLPAWAQQLSLLTLLLLIVTSFLRGWIVTRAQSQRELDAERRIADIWKSNFQQSTQLNERLTDAFQPVLEGQNALLRAVESLQRDQEERERRMRDWRGRQV